MFRQTGAKQKSAQTQATEQTDGRKWRQTLSVQVAKIL